MKLGAPGDLGGRVNMEGAGVWRRCTRREGGRREVF